ncbi:hypothetical protein [Streptomyces sp. B21-083]|uniref:hypothetical protein n=1 Tax=Streptomyces sp. B21-083 TaxID=3039410 RepID=UPI002FEF116E
METGGDAAVDDELREDRLFVTTARYGVPNPTPASGSVLTVPVAVRGTAACSWRGEPRRS